MSWFKKYQSLSLVAAGFFVMVGTYNAVVINSESSLYSSDVKFVKRLDEMYGVTIPGREAASVSSWQKLAPTRQVPTLAKSPRYITQTVSNVEAAPAIQEVAAPAAAVQEELSLDLVEVINPNKYKNGLPNTQFNGSLATRDGVIESLNVSLPNGEGVSVSFSEMNGNVFNYDYDGELYSGMMYQVDQSSYMVTLTNGPLEGTRLRFNSNAASDIHDNQINYEAEVAQNEMVNQSIGNDADQYEQQQKLEDAQMEQARNEVETPPMNELQQTDPQAYDLQLQQQQAQAYHQDQIQEQPIVQ